VSNEPSGTKNDAGKPPIDLVPTDGIRAVAAVLAFGAKKYDRNNWRKGIITSRLYAAAMRHLMAWNDGEDTDPESGLPHLAHAACNIFFLLEQQARRPEFDDRYLEAAP